MIQGMYRLFIELTNGRWSSRMIRGFSLSKRSRHILPSYAKVFRINEEEMEKPLNSYASLHELFVRTLKEGARPIHRDEDSVISPVDAVIEDIGEICATKQITVKEKVYSIAEMIGNEDDVQKYIGGTYMIFYLSPSDYHRIHSPVNGQVLHTKTLGKKSYPVNTYGLKYGKEPLSKNYRVITEVAHEAGLMTIVKVGAMFVNSIEQTYTGDTLTMGEEIAYFSFGSTVILLFEQHTFTLDAAIGLGKKIKMGEKIGQARRSES